MRLTTKCRYGARAIVEIARRQHNGPVKRKDIVKNQSISDSYLENILISLKSSGIITTIRGAKGGYTLRRLPSKITFLEIVRALEGSYVPVECLVNAAACDKSGSCSTQKVWQKLKDTQELVLGAVTVADLLRNEEECQTLNFDI